MAQAAPASKCNDIAVIHERGASKLPYIDLRGVHITLRAKIFVADFTWHLIIVEGERLADLSLRVWEREVGFLEVGKNDITRIVVVPWRQWHFDELGRFVGK
jgi:hypothetical protein